jgi:hypothetical protein
MKHREHISDHIDRLFDKVAAAAEFRLRLPEAIDDCLRIVAQARSEQPAFAELGRIMGPRVRSHDVVLRKNAWIAQHALGERFCCVGNYIVFRRRARRGSKAQFRYESPLIDQLDMQGLLLSPHSLEKTYQQIEQNTSLLKIGGMAVDAPNSTIYLLHGLSYSQARRLRPSLGLSRSKSGATLPLFGHEDRPLSGSAIPMQMANAIAIGADLLRSAVPGFRVVPVAMISADPDAGWGYQIHDLSEFRPQGRGVRLLDLDEHPLISSSLSQNRLPARDLEQLPRQLAGREILRAAPVDRATRSFMVLTVLWDLQQSQPSRLAFMSVKRIAEEVGRRFGVVYSRDLHRHDLEDCLQALGYIEEPHYHPGHYAISHRGVGRLCMFMASTGGGVSHGAGRSIEENVVHHIMQQSKRMDDYCFGPVKVA